MKNIYQLSLFLFALLLAAPISAQRYVKIAASTDPTNPKDIFPVIMGDTTANGARVDSNTIYQLENGQVYVTTRRIVNKPGWALQIEAVNLEDTGNKPILSRIPNASGTWQDVMWPEGNLRLTNLWIISGETGPLQQHDWGRMRITGANARVIVKDCIIEKDRGGFLQVRANGVKMYIENCEFRNGGNRRILQGNGRGIDCREFTMDTLIIRNTIVYNIQDRFLRSQGARNPHKYVEIDHCTSFNTAGRHGHIQLGRVLTAKITNNLFINPIMMGTSPVYTDEQSQPDKDKHKVITIDTIYENTSLTISNNNIFWTQDVLDYWATNDTVSMPPVLSDLIVQKLGAAAANAYFQEPLALNNVPGTILPYVVDLYKNPKAEDMYDFIVEDVSLKDTPYDSGNLFDFTKFDPCYDPSTQSATASTTGAAIGAVSGCSNLVNSLFDIPLNNALALQVSPNPASEMINIQFELQQSSQVTVLIRNLNGQVVAQPLQASLPAGKQNFTWSFASQLPQGMYFVTLQTKMGIMTRKLMVN